jgi:hypothetical protein
MQNAAKMIINNLPKLEKSFEELSNLDLYVGVPSDKKDRKDNGDPDQPNNATIAYINDSGSPAMRIPQRSFMRPGISDARQYIIKRMSKGGAAILAGETDAAYTTLAACGLTAQNAIRRRINDGIPPPLSEQTLKERIANRAAIKGSQAELDRRAAGEQAGTDLAKPLVATGQLRNSITYVIRKRSK